MYTIFIHVYMCQVRGKAFLSAVRMDCSGDNFCENVRGLAYALFVQGKEGEEHFTLPL